MGNIWVTSDTHFGHDRAFVYQPRGFKNIYDHDKQIIKNWNQVAQPNDEVYHLGDVMLGNNDYGISCLKQLKGNIHIIRGNHCTDTRIKLYSECWNVVEVCEAKYLKYKKIGFFLCHYPTITSNLDDDKPLKARIVNLCGHSHTKNKFQDIDKGTIYHCELDAHDCYPVLLDNIIEEIKTKAKECEKYL